MSEYGNHLDVDGNVKAWQARAPGDCVVLGDDLKIPEEYLPEGTVVTTPVQSISISGTLSGQTGGYLTLTATVSPEDATTPAVSWEVTSGTSVAVIISQTGTSCTVYLQSAGEATVTAAATDGSGVSQSVTVTATDPVVPVTSITIFGETEGEVGGTVMLAASVLPANATDRSIAWAITSGSAYATIQSQTDTSCVVSLTAEGTVVITATAQDGSGVTATHTISVSTPFVPVTDIVISGDESGNIGTYVTLTATVTPENATNPSLVWAVTSGSEYIAISSQTGNICTVYCQAEGSGVVTATAQDGSGVTATHIIRSIDPNIYVTSIEISGDTSGTEGDTITLTATVSPANATNPAVTWMVSSGDECISIRSQTTSSCVVSLDAAGSGTIMATAQDGSDVTQTFNITVRPRYGGQFRLNLDSATMATDPTGCFTYAGDCAGFTPVSNTSPSLAKVTSEGSWAYDEETGFDCMGRFYATFQNGSGGQYLHQLLNPYDLSRYIALWDDEEKEWDYGQTGASSITSENTMWCSPTIWRLGAEGYVIHSTESFSGGTARAHTIGGTVYDYNGIGVFPAYNDGGTLKSISGVTATRSTTRANFRTYAQANTVRNGWAGLWNWHQWEYWKEACYFAGKSFNLQAQVGNGGLSYSMSTATTGLCNDLGPFAGDVSGTSDSVKCFIENGWGYIYQFIDDVYGSSGRWHIGNNESPTDNTSGKDITVEFNNMGAFPLTILQTDVGWSIGATNGGSSTTGTCDYQTSNSPSSYPVPYVGGSSDNVSSGAAGPGYLSCNTASSSHTSLGSRLAFCFNV